MSQPMDYQVRYRAIRDDKIMCEVVTLDAQRRPTGPIVVKGVGNSKDEAKAAALAATSDPVVRQALS
jgi:hypothetical protein